ncbi:CHAT domain-containing protein [Streptomyces sp. FXJ1.172]|uniref:CHAT domain-containing protein n=1 Tax=Streptomyces sp. FXJ1.172 TaxID=710705 RepID=UPI0007CF1A40|nr:CHAT domain-containing protein [Streptomyces sp. FXJ1.172]WEO94406.1 CHAT domain-containing protein [Streptomyces sp. FXJ1.172]
MTEAGTPPAAGRAAAALARTDGFCVPLDPGEYEGTRGPALDALTEELALLHGESASAHDGGATAAAVAARLGRCHAVRFVLDGDAADRERALPLLTEARTSALLGEADREAARRDLLALLASRLVRLGGESPAAPSGESIVDRVVALSRLGTPLAQGGPGILEDTALLMRLLLEGDDPRITPQHRDTFRVFGEMTDALQTGDTATLFRGGRRIAATADAALPQPLAALAPVLVGPMEQILGALPQQPEGTSDAPAGEPDTGAGERDLLTQLLALGEVMAPGSIEEQDVSRILAELSGTRRAGAGADGRTSLSSRMIAALFHVALAARTGDMEGFREALRLMHEASAAGELDSRVHSEWLRTVVPGLLVGASLTGGSLQDEDMARALLEARQWDDAPSNGPAATLRLGGECIRLQERLTSALDRGDAGAVEDVIDAVCELELDDTYAGAEAWTGTLTGFLLGSAYLGRVVLAASAEERTADLRAAAHHLQRAVQTSVDMPALRNLLDIAWGPLIALTAIAESDPSRIAEGVRRARAALDVPGFASDFRPRARAGIALALDTLHRLTGDAGALDEAIAEQERALAELPDGGPGRARLTWDLAELRAERAALKADPPGAEEDLLAAVGLARASLRHCADDVLLQQGTGRGLRIARAAADRGRRAAFWALRAGHAEEALACLEAGRSLVLGAAAVSAGVADRLAALGESALAERWRAAADPVWEQGDDRSLREMSAGAGPGGIGDLRDRSPLKVLAAAGGGAPGLPGDVRRRSLEVLRERGAAGVQPGPASLRDLRAGLRASSADALLYLVPGVEDPDGAVLLVTRDGPVEELPLPSLAPAGRGPVAEYLAAGARRQSLDAGGAAGESDRSRAEQRRLRALDRLCTWAGEVLGPALDRLGGWDRARAEVPGTPAGAGAGGAVRLVVVPCGELGVVPWPAAVLRPPAGHGAARPVRACEAAVLTHAASGREFLRAVARRRMAPAERPALVFHGADDLEWAEEEIETLAGVFYPGAVVHHPDDDPATPQAVLALLGGRAAAPASLVHLACHGLAGPDPTRSALRLAAPAGAAEASGGGELTLSTLLEAPGEGDAFRSAGPLVVCGGCETDLTTRDHDEALTVTSVLVHRLAADAIGSRWKVDDRASELLMLVLHDALARGLAPPDALRAAQRWMLTAPDERPPVPALKGIAAAWRLTEDFRERPDTWAAFVHHGNPAPATAPAPAVAHARPQEGERA